MAKNLVIVESPAKAKTIEGYLGKEYKVASSYGHVRDLPKDDSAIDIENGFQPKYEISKDKKEVIENLKKLVKDAELIYLASDDDREGEAISWHLKEALNLEDARTRRIVFHEITKNAIQNALENPRGIDLDLVNAQQARRVLDRLVGFELSPILWKKIKTGLSAGRVQSVAVRLVVEREREIESFKSGSNFRVQALFKLDDGSELNAELSSRFNSIDKAEDFLNKCLGAEFNIEKLQKKPGKRSSSPPFTTSTLQQEAGRKLGYSVSQTMILAQKLYEAGKISYMRTDSLSLSEDAISNAASRIKQSYGDKYLHIKHYKTKSKGAQEAHEAIRPTDFSDLIGSNDKREQKLYELIWKRAIASQMADAQLEKTTATIGISTTTEKFIATGEVVIFDGFLKVYVESREEEDENSVSSGILPPLRENQVLNMYEIKSREVFSKHPPRYTEASLVKKLEELGIGRPSTYAPTISTIQKRGYISKETRDGKERKYQSFRLRDGKITKSVETEITGYEKNKLFPTNTAMVVNDFLVENFPTVTNYSFTAEVEKEFDDIASGKKVWNKMLKDFYGNFHERVEFTNTLKKSDVGPMRKLGIDPKSGKPIFARLGKFGPVVQIGTGEEEEEKPRFASMRNGQFIESITLEDAIELFKLPRELGDFEGSKVDVNIGRFGPYVRHEGKFISLPKEDDPYSVELERAIGLIKEKREADSKKLIRSFPENPDIQVLNGRFGPYIKAGSKNVKIPKGKIPEELTLEECLELVEKAPEKKKFIRRKK
ncbi:MAG TPA: type I DNA topoisomerase [Cyclobacteriaceae bacterium]|jgi:DNA topoisomerase-1